MKKLIVLIVLAMLLVACGVPQVDYDTAVKQISSLESSLTNSQADLKQTTIQLLETEAKLDNSAVLLSELQSKYDNLSVSKDNMTLLYTEAQENIETLYSKLKPHLCDLLGMEKLTTMRYESIMDVSTILQAYESGLPWVLRVSGTRRDTIWSNTQTKIHSVTYRHTDGEMYVDHFLVYFDEFGWDKGVFWISEQCWLDRP